MLRSLNLSFHWFTDMSCDLGSKVTVLSKRDICNIKMKWQISYLSKFELKVTIAHQLLHYLNPN